MPGVSGFVCSTETSSDSRTTLSGMLSMLSGGGNEGSRVLFCDRQIAHGQVCRGAAGGEVAHSEWDGIRVWLHGEIHDFGGEVARGGAFNVCETLARMYLRFASLDFLCQANGNFIAVVYDSRRSLILLATDRYGIGRVYWTNQGGRLAWSSELKAFLALPRFTPRIDRRAVDQFLQVGYCLDNVTWFDGVCLLRAGSVLTCEVATGQVRVRQYWSWESIASTLGNIAPREASREVGRLFLQAVRRRAEKHERVGLLLSGGRDSRAILAAIPEDSRRVPAVTFGKVGAAEVDVAKRAASVRSALHHVRHIDASNWLNRRVEGVWWVDGEVSLLHMHVCAVTELLPALFDFELNGFAGDLILGGSYLLSPRFLAPDHDVLELAARTMGCSADSLREWNVQPFVRSDHFFLNNRVRRFTRSGLILEELAVATRTPFFDNDLIDFVYSLPDQFRYRGQLYNEMLLECFPSFFSSIPIAKSGKPIQRVSNFPVAAEYLRYYCAAVGERVIRAVGHRSDSPSFTDYPNWIRSDPARGLLSGVLGSSDALHREFTQHLDTSSLVAEHFNGANRTVLICRLLTLEVWLRQVFSGEFRPDSTQGGVSLQ